MLEKHLVENRLKHSRQREIILEHFLETRGHLTVDDLYRVLRRNHSHIGRTTIYRTLKLLCDAGIAVAVDLKDGITRFEPCKDDEHHDHMVCVRCGAIVEFTSREIERLQNEIARSHGFIVNSHRHQIFGVCEKCQGKERSRGASSKETSTRGRPRTSQISVG